MTFIASCGAPPFIFGYLIIRAEFTDEIGRFGDGVPGVVREDRVRTSVTCSVHTRQLLIEINHRQISLRGFVLAKQCAYMVRSLAITHVVAVIQNR